MVYSPKIATKYLAHPLDPKPYITSAAPLPTRAPMPPSRRLTLGQRTKYVDVCGRITTGTVAKVIAWKGAFTKVAAKKVDAANDTVTEAIADKGAAVITKVPAEKDAVGTNESPAEKVAADTESPAEKEDASIVFTYIVNHDNGAVGEFRSDRCKYLFGIDDEIPQCILEEADSEPEC